MNYLEKIFGFKNFNTYLDYIYYDRYFLNELKNKIINNINSIYFFDIDI